MDINFVYEFLFREYKLKQKLLKPFLSTCFNFDIYFVLRNDEWCLKRDRGEIPTLIKKVFSIVEWPNFWQTVEDADLVYPTEEGNLYTMISDQSLCKIFGLEKECLISTLLKKDFDVFLMWDENGDIIHFFETQDVPKFFPIFDDPIFDEMRKYRAN